VERREQEEKQQRPTKVRGCRNPLQPMEDPMPVMVWLQPATKAPRGRPSPCRGAEENGKKEAENWWVGIRAV